MCFRLLVLFSIMSTTSLTPSSPNNTRSTATAATDSHVLSNCRLFMENPKKFLLQLSLFTITFLVSMYTFSLDWSTFFL